MAFIIIGITWFVISLNQSKRFIAKARQIPQVNSNGVQWGDLFISWSDIDRIYLSGKRTSVNLIPTRETRAITLVSKTGLVIPISIDVVGWMGGSVLRAYQEVHQQFLQHIGGRQWREFLADYESGKLIWFGNFSIGRDGLYFTEYQYRKAPLSFLSD